MMKMSIATCVRSVKHVNFSRPNTRRQNLCLAAYKVRANSLAASSPAATTQKAEIKTPPDATETTQTLSASQELEVKPNDRRFFRRILFNAIATIEELSHMDEVRVSQQRVIQLKDKLFESGEKKRQVLHSLAEIRRDLKRVHADSVVIARGTDGYLALVHNEIKLLKEEERLQAIYDKADEEERNLFTSLTAAINDSYEKEKVHANTLRLWGLIITIFTSTITLVLSTIGHYYHTTQLALVGNRFKDTDSIFKEIQLLNDSIERISLAKQAPVEQPAITAESWGAYISRKTAGIYRYFFPKRQ